MNGVKGIFCGVLALLAVVCAVGCARLTANPAAMSEQTAGVQASEIGVSPSPLAQENAQAAGDADESGAGAASGAQSSAERGAYRAVLQGDAEFFSMDAGQSLKIDQLAQAVGLAGEAKVEAVRVAVVDLDGDGAKEAVLGLSVDGDESFGYLILRSEAGVVSSYLLWYRAFLNLKADGTFSFSSGAEDSGFGTLRFDGETCTTDAITYSESEYDADNRLNVSYYVNRNSATQEAFLLELGRQAEKKDADWYDCANGVIPSALA